MISLNCFGPMDTLFTCSPSLFFDRDPCTVPQFEVAEFDENATRSLSVFLWAVIIVAFLLIITYTCLVNTSKLALVNSFKNNLARLDVGDSGVPTHKDQGKTFVIEKPKNTEGGVAVVILVLVCVVMIAYVVATEIDLPAEVISLRTHFPDPLISSKTFIMDSLRFDWMGQRRHEIDFGVLVTENLKSSQIYFETEISACRPRSEKCKEGDLDYITYSMDFWRRWDVVTLCSDQELADNSTTLFTRTGIMPFAKQATSLPNMYYGEPVMLFDFPELKTDPSPPYS